MHETPGTSSETCSSTTTAQSHDTRLDNGQFDSMQFIAVWHGNYDMFGNGDARRKRDEIPIKNWNGMEAIAQLCIHLFLLPQASIAINIEFYIVFAFSVSFPFQNRFVPSTKLREWYEQSVISVLVHGLAQRVLENWWRYQELTYFVWSSANHWDERQVQHQRKNARQAFPLNEKIKLLTKLLVIIIRMRSHTSFATTKMWNGVCEWRVWSANRARVVRIL